MFELYRVIPNTFFTCGNTVSSIIMASLSTTTKSTLIKRVKGATNGADIFHHFIGILLLWRCKIHITLREQMATCGASLPCLIGFWCCMILIQIDNFKRGHIHKPKVLILHLSVAFRWTIKWTIQDFIPSFFFGMCQYFRVLILKSFWT